MNKKKLDAEILANEVTRDLKDDLYPDIEVTNTKRRLANLFKRYEETGEVDEESGLHVLFEIMPEHRDTYGDDPETLRIRHKDIAHIVKRCAEPPKKLHG
jgi:hypothetical protein